MLRPFISGGLRDDGRRSFHLAPRHMLETLRSAVNVHKLMQLAYFMDEANQTGHPTSTWATSSVLR